MNPVLAVVLAAWPLWAALIVTYVLLLVDAHQDASWEAQNTLPGNLNERRDR